MTAAWRRRPSISRQGGTHCRSERSRPGRCLEALLGGLDAASLALGATVVSPTFGEVSEQSLHDGLALEGAGFVGSIASEPVLMTVDLATDDLVPVSGVIIDPLAGREGYGRDAAAVRPAAVRRRHDVGCGPVRGAEPSAGGSVIHARYPDPGPIRATADPIDVGGCRGHPGARGVAGHRNAGLGSGGRARHRVPSARRPCRVGPAGATDPRQLEGMLDEAQDPNDWAPYMEPDIEVSWVVGFRDGRAAQVTELQWVDPADTDP